MEHDVQESGAPQTGVSSDTQYNANEVETQSQHHDEFKNTQGSPDGPSTEIPSANVPEPSPDMERYRQMEAFLLQHRKEYESKNSPYLKADWQPVWPRKDAAWFDKFGPWNRTWDFWSTPEYKRPNPFELTNDLSAFQNSQNKEEKDEFDMAIDYGAARNRLRKNFEWDLDRLFLIEEIAVRKQKKEEDARKKAEMDSAERTNAALKDGPTLKLNCIQWFTFRRLAGKLEIERCVIDVLIGHPIIDDNMDSMFARRVRRAQKPHHPELGKAMKPGQDLLPERIRINSGVLKKILSRMLSADLSDFGETASFVLVRPFKSLFHCYDNVRAMVEKLEEKFLEKQDSITSAHDDAESRNDLNIKEPSSGQQERNSQETSVGSVPIPESKEILDSTQVRTKEHEETEDATSDEEDEDREGPDQEDDPNDPNQSEMAFQHLKVLREFMDSKIQAKITYLQTDECRKVFFSDLWYLFRPGQEVISRDGKQAYRIVNVRSQRHRRTQPWDAWRWYNSQDSEDKKKKKGPFSVTCVYIDFDGSSIGPVSKSFDFKQFDGQMEITSMPVYPIRLHPLRRTEISDVDWRELESLPSETRYRQHLINRGTRFLKVLGIRPMYYAGPTLGVRDDIESQVVIDFETAFTVEDGKQGTWKPNLEMILGEPESDDDEEYDLNCTGDCCKWDSVYDDSYIDDKQRSRYVNSLLPSSDGLNTQPSIAVFPQLLADLKNDTNRTGYSVSEDELVIMSCRVFGFVLRHRQWAELDLTYLTELHAHRQPVQKPQNNKDTTSGGRQYKTAFDNLVLEEKQKPMIQALVAQHFRDKEHRAGQTEQMDIVKGKGKGLILLLHGAPGVGKTSTAEGVAELFNRPLFQITCGDLGTTANEVEKTLDLNFTLANRWDCILLLDEADVFLAQRNKEDFKRNGLVAVFLRVLEYYAGVLFLTTNRIGDFDEAFTSRIHVSLYYPELNCDKTIKVFNINIQMMKERFEDKGRTIVVDDIQSFAEAHYNKNENARWNGRQIRNACQTALALAEFEAQGSSHMAVLNPDAVVHLKLSHFETVQQAYLDFAHYMDTVYGSTAETRAQENHVRAILDMMGETERRGAKVDSFGTARSRKFRDEVRAKSDIRAQQPVAPVSQPMMAQPFAQPMHPVSGNQQYVAANAGQPQGYYSRMAVPQNVHPQYAQPMGTMPMQQHSAAVFQSMNPMQHQPQPHQSQSPPTMQQAYYLSPSTPQAWDSPTPNSSNSKQQYRAVAEVSPRTPPSRQQQYPAPAGDSPFLQRNVEEMYSAGSSQAPGTGYSQQQPQQQQQQHEQSGGGTVISSGRDGPVPSGQMSGNPGSFHHTGAPLGNQGQWPGAQGSYSAGGPG
ncbi:ATPase family AAA domain-containing protein 3B [Apiospora rasikravindrae]|uniref:ATPase family AAA domain-containing protein 3B n=1 Tax=Apiospora rasikravindrae TaxID=990691 RepID=A0ABR1SFE7_9PEZI